MQRFFSIIVIFAILVVGGGYLWVEKGNQETERKIKEELQSARRNFADKARAAINSEESSDYVRGVQAALKSYDEELKKRVYAKKPELRDPTAYEKRVEEEFKAGRLQESQRKSMLEGYGIVKKAHDTLMAASWKPVLTAKGPGDVRVDIYDLERTRDEEGNPILEGKAFFWGIEDSTRVSWQQLALRYWTLEMGQVKEGKKMVEKEIEKVLGRAEGDATPRIIIPSPANYVTEFPSFVSPGFIWIPLMPREAKFVDIEYGFTAKKGGDAYDSRMEWKKLTIPTKWKLAEGEAWDADVIEATEDEIAGKDSAE